MVLALVTAPVALAACSSGSSSSERARALARPHRAGERPRRWPRRPRAICQQLNGVFSDGPDPDADPVGYALSQILPLHKLHSSDTPLMATVSRLVTTTRTS